MELLACECNSNERCKNTRANLWPKQNMLIYCSTNKNHESFFVTLALLIEIH